MTPWWLKEKVTLWVSLFAACVLLWSQPTAPQCQGSLCVNHPGGAAGLGICKPVTPGSSLGTEVHILASFSLQCHTHSWLFFLGCPSPSVTFSVVGGGFLSQKRALPILFFFFPLQVAAGEELQKERFCATARKIQESVELKLRALPCLRAPKKNKMHGSCRLVLRNKRSASQRGIAGCMPKEAVPAVSAAEVVRELQVREASLQRELQQLREQCRRRLHGIAEGWEGVICISPWREKPGLGETKQWSGLVTLWELRNQM